MTINVYANNRNPDLSELLLECPITTVPITVGTASYYSYGQALDILKTYRNATPGQTFQRAVTNQNGTWTNNFGQLYGNYSFRLDYSTLQIIRTNLITTTTDTTTDSFDFNWSPPIPISDTECVFDSDPDDGLTFNFIRADPVNDTHRIIGTIENTLTGYSMFKMLWSSLLDNKVIWFYVKEDQAYQYPCFLAIYNIDTDNFTEIELPSVERAHVDVRLNNWVLGQGPGDCRNTYSGPVVHNTDIYIPIEYEWDTDDQINPTPIIIWKYNSISNNVSILKWFNSYDVIGLWPIEAVIPYPDEESFYIATLNQYIYGHCFVLKIDMTTDTITEFWHVLDATNQQITDRFLFAFTSKTKGYRSQLNWNTYEFTIVDIATEVSYGPFPTYTPTDYVEYIGIIDDDGKVWGLTMATRHLKSWDLATGSIIDDIDLSSLLSGTTNRWRPRLNGDTFSFTNTFNARNSYYVR